MNKLIQKFRSLPKRFKIVIAMILFLGLVFVLWPKPQSTPPLFASVERGDLQDEVQASGTLSGKAVANLKFRSSGKLSFLRVKEGDTVTKGQLIAGLDAQDLAINLQQAENTLREKQAAVDKTLDDVKGHDKDETFTQKSTRTAAEVSRDNAYDAVKEAKRAFQDIYIYSPIDGVVTSQSDIVVGQNVATTDLIAQVVDFSEKVFIAEIDEADIGQVAIGQKAEVNLNAYPEIALIGEVSKISPHTKTASSGATVVEVEITLEENSLSEISGLNGTVSIVNLKATGALIIPQEALTDENQVLVQTPTGLELKKVALGVKSDSKVSILEGLSENDQVVTNPQLVAPSIQRKGFFQSLFNFSRNEPRK